jgi:hypothetical protein
MMSAAGRSSSAIYSRIKEELSLTPAYTLRRARFFHVLYKRLGKDAKFTWLFFLTEVVSAQVPGQGNANIERHCILRRSATP